MTPPVRAALESGGIVVVHDEASDHAALILLAARTDAPTLAFCVRHTSGYLGVTVQDARAVQLRLPLLGDVPGRPRYAVAVDAASGITTGISAADRARTARILARPASVPEDLSRPGHVVPIRVPDDRAEALGLAEVASHNALALTGEGSLIVAALTPLNDPLGDASWDDAYKFAARWNLAVMTVMTVMTVGRDRARPLTSNYS
jgi:3,4-dihydroxy 2-butanone 4-phosphate synthase/GTP cyclohydrolase II